jgi:hypothetical protein
VPYRELQPSSPGPSHRLQTQLSAALHRSRHGQQNYQQTAKDGEAVGGAACFALKKGHHFCALQEESLWMEQVPLASHSHPLDRCSFGLKMSTGAVFSWSVLAPLLSEKEQAPLSMVGMSAGARRTEGLRARVRHR